ncbi:MAG: c-type cytochrome [Myxococcaceae bacterium]|nr:c-type cytochrome [Myxococcaceae bacterium]
MRLGALTAVVCVVALAGCRCRAPTPEQEAQRYLTDARFRRAAMEASLVNPKNIYSRQRLDAYGLETRGWDLLPEWNPRSIQVGAAQRAQLERGASPELDDATAPLWDGATPTSREGWLALGQQVFFRYPLRSEPLAAFALSQPELAEQVGLERSSDGTYPGLVLFRDVDGVTRVGLTCALCHSAHEHGALVVGAARRHFDYGKLRLAHRDQSSATIEPGLAARLARWGPGRADVTEDDDEDPVAIPDLWGLASQEALTQAGTIAQASPVALALRQETQLLQSNHERVRPPRVLAWALAQYVLSLTPPPGPAHPPSPRGEALFDRGCRSCHSNAAFGGKPVDASAVGTDLALAKGRARGTGLYRPPALLRVRQAAPYLHHGAVSTLEELFSPARLEPGYLGSPLGPGPVPGHRWGTDWSADDRAALIAYLDTL